MLEFVGDEEGAAAPRLAETRPGGRELVVLWNDLVASLRTLADHGLAHGDLSAYNLLAHDGHLVMIDLPQVVDIIAHPSGAEFLARDVANITCWFLARGLADQPPRALTVPPDDLLAYLSY